MNYLSEWRTDLEEVARKIEDVGVERVKVLSALTTRKKVGITALNTALIRPIRPWLNVVRQWVLSLLSRSVSRAHS